ncbi:MAG: hypothetical protein JNM27_01980 [Leptospirales bacterium]|nr:hypothetical protein [Leptospirales bacterium]
MKSSQKKNSKRASRPDRSAIELTSLGVPLLAGEAGRLVLDLSDLKLFKGLSVLAGMLGEEILDQARRGADIAVQHRIVPGITPQLEELGITGITIHARKSVLKSLPSYRSEFHTQIRAVFGTLQRPSWGGVLFPEFFGQERLESNPPGLVFPYHLHFEQEEIDYFFLVERDIQGAFLRITIETEGEGRLDLKKIPHFVVNDLNRRTYLQGLTHMAESMQTGIRRESENFQNEHLEDKARQPSFFAQIEQAGLDQCEIITVHWPIDSEERLISGPPDETIDFLRRCLIVLEDREIVAKLHSQEIEVISGNRRAYLDLSRRGRSLNLSLDVPRKFPDIRRYLAKMPILETLSQKRPDSLKGVRVFLIHHITGEILATIRALENMNCDFLRVLFVKYAGIVPAEYLETLLSLPEDQFAFHGLNKIEPSGSVEGYYILSRQYSPITKFGLLDQLLHAKRSAFFEAMQTAAGHLFFVEAGHCIRDNKKLLLMEDGGYLAPQINALCLEGKTVKQAMVHYGIEPGKKNEGLKAVLPVADAVFNKPLAAWLQDFFCGSVEHTRNGYDRLLAVQTKHKRLQFPALSIAISNTKREMESREVSVSILHAIESVLHGQGLVLSNRRALVLGSRGAIGRCLVSHLKDRMGPASVSGVDIIVNAKNQNDQGIAEAATPAKLSHHLLYDADIIIGVIGKSILTDDLIGDLILNHKRPSIFFASGSTKTLEFTHLSQFIEKLRRMKEPSIKGKSVRVESEPVRDPQTGLIQGSKIRIELNKQVRSLYLLGGLTPINFLYYGVPTETMDPVLTQLVQAAAGLTRNRNGKHLPARLLAVDHEITPDAELMHESR